MSNALVKQYKMQRINFFSAAAWKNRNVSADRLFVPRVLFLQETKK